MVGSGQETEFCTDRLGVGLAVVDIDELVPVTDDDGSSCGVEGPLGLASTVGTWAAPVGRCRPM